MTPLLPGSAQGRVLKLPSLSLWGGVDPFSGKLTDPALPHCGESVKDRVLMIGEPVGSSSSSAVLLELCMRAMRRRRLCLAAPTPLWRWACWWRARWDGLPFRCS